MAAVWKGEDEAKLLDCIEDRGFGNWCVLQVQIVRCESGNKHLVPAFLSAGMMLLC